MPRTSIVVFSILLGATLAFPAAAQWKWRDQTGQMQYSDLPPPSGVADKDILHRPTSTQRRLPPAPAASAASAPGLAAPKAVEPELEAKRRNVEEEQVAKNKAEADKVAAARVENCSRARSQLRMLEDGMRIARVNDKGEREVLDDKARADEMKRARDIVSSDCK